MTASVRRRTSFSRALLALVALAALLLGGALAERGPSGGSTEAHVAAATAIGEHEHAAPSLHAIHQQPSTRARSKAFTVLALTIVVAAWAFRRLRFQRVGRLRTLRISGLPPGRAPPALRIV
jgi:hypothetical protein